MKTSFLFLAEGFETIEALTPIDVLRRAGMPVTTVSLTAGTQVTSVQGVKVNADVIFDQSHFTDPAWLILPGGMPGAQNLYDFAPLRGLLQAQYERQGGRIAAICASPAVVLGQLGLLEGHKATCYPGFENLLRGAEVIDMPVVADSKFVLSNGPANALLWSLSIVKEELGAETAQRIANDMLLYPRNGESLNNYFG